MENLKNVNVETGEITPVKLYGQFNTKWPAREPDYEVNTMESQTVPNQSMTIQEIMQKHVRGGEIVGNDSGWYSDLDLPDLSRMDISEIEAYKADVRRDIAEMRARLELADEAVENKADASETDFQSVSDAPQESPNGDDKSTN